MGKKTKAKTKAKAASKAPTRAPARAAAPAPKTTSKKRVSSKAPAPSAGGTLLDVMGDMFSGGSSANLPSLPIMGKAAPIQYNPSTGTFQRRKKSRKGLSAGDIKGFMRVNKFAGMLTKVSGKKHHVVSKRRK